MYKPTTNIANIYFLTTNIDKNNMSNPLSLRQLEYLVAVAETGQISRAALRCNVSQSSMTIALKKLEHILDCKLLIRHAKGVDLSAAGEVFVIKARNILNDVEHAVESIVLPPADMTGQIRLGITETFSAYLLPTLLPALRKQFPNIIFNIHEYDRADIEQALLADTLDLGIIIVSNLQEKTHLHYEIMLRSERNLWLDPENLLQYSTTITLADVAQQPFILLDMDEHLINAAAYWEASQLAPNIHFHSRSLESVRSLVAMGQGVTILSDLVYRQFSLEGRRLIRRPLNEQLPTMNVGCIWKKQPSLVPNLSDVIEFIRKKITDTQQ
ncbi:LysR family transcriptional regulator [Photobacterium kishitanii]|uniref:LysR family transcriptional regulator n=2 Tax=Photobacterium kishitanii TaxID=318456 RepID=A0A2T3KD93_9GAMM|nr:LysR family transcriptional regulator [Photobacterium kishitanii]